MRGRPTKLTTEVQERLGQAIRMGLTHKEAAAYAGIGERTFYDWMRDKAHFAQFINAREGEGQATLLALIQRAAKEDWRAAAWILEHRWPEEWAKSRIDIHHSGSLDVTMRLDVVAAYGAILEQMFPDQPEVVENFAQRAKQLEGRRDHVDAAQSRRLARHTRRTSSSNGHTPPPTGEAPTPS